MVSVGVKDKAFTTTDGLLYRIYPKYSNIHI